MRLTAALDGPRETQKISRFTSSPNAPFLCAVLQAAWERGFPFGVLTDNQLTDPAGIALLQGKLWGWIFPVVTETELTQGADLRKAVTG